LDFLAINHYTTFFTYQSQKDTSILVDAGVNNIVDDNYATASSAWLQVSRLWRNVFLSNYVNVQLQVVAVFYVSSLP
jgi:hypothetical protein